MSVNIIGVLMYELISSDEFTFMYNILKGIRDGIFLNWGFHTTVALAKIGWLVSMKFGLSKAQKWTARIGYSGFVIAISWSFIKLYLEYSRVVMDIHHIFPKAVDALPKSGHIYHTLNPGYFWKISGTLAIVVVTYILVMFIIWFDPGKRSRSS